MRSPVQDLTTMARWYRAEQALSIVVLWLGAGMLLAGVSYWMRGDTSLRLSIPLAALALGALHVWWADSHAAVRADTIARHLDRVLPELEESATLLLPPPASEPPLTALQRRRVEARWDGARAARTLPHRALLRAVAVGVPLALLGALFLRGTIAMPGAHSAWNAVTGERITLQQTRVLVTPPRYTGVPTRELDAAGSVDAEEGSTLDWKVTTSGAVQAVWLLTLDGDSLPLTRQDGEAWALTTRADHSALVRIRVDGSDSLTLVSDDYRVAVRADKPPVLTVLRPEERTTLPPGKVAPVSVEVVAVDDYGLDSASISVTLASGRGEAVQFKRMRLGFTSRTRRRQGGELLRGTIDLPRFGLAAGDELYFSVEATDHRTPVPNRAHSATLFITIEDTSRARTADVAKLALNAQPEYFRSQRQLIIDTEKLLAEQSRISRTEFRDRANEIGIDQGLLRLRYGQFLGEEFEEQASEMGGREHAATEAEAPPTRESTADQSGKAAADQAKAEATQGLTHAHDDAENATLLGNRVKGMLRTAVGAMWKAELHLRTAEPRQALPFMHQALDLIKLIQQDARVYVQRVGFEPPPIEIDKLRLSGKLSDIADRRVTEQVAAHDSLPAVHRALALMGRAAGRDSLPDALQAAGQELAGLAVQDPRLLPVLKDVRELIDSLQRNAPCPCSERVARGLWAALPRPEPRAALGALPASPLGLRFAQLLRGSP